MYLTPYWNCDFSLCLLWSKAFNQNEHLSLVFKTVVIWRLLHSAKCLFYMNRGLQTVRGYSPPQDVEARVHDIASDMYGETKDWLNHRLDNKADKLQVCISVMDRVIPCIVGGLGGGGGQITDIAQQTWGHYKARCQWLTFCFPFLVKS